MKRFTYRAVDRHGLAVEGSVEALDWQAAEQMLVARGLVECQEISAETLPSLSSADAAELAGYLSELAKSGLPLGNALRALGADASSVSLRKVIDDLADRIESGHSLESALESLGGRLPDHIRRLLTSAAQSGRLTEALEGLLAQQTKVSDMTARLRQALAYPAVLLLLLIAWLLFICWEVVPGVTAVFGDFWDVSEFGPSRNNANATLVTALTEFARFFPTLLVTLAVGGVILWGATRFIAGAGAVSRLLGAVPLLGSCWKYRGLTDFTGLLAEFLQEKIPLAEALALTAGGTRDPALGDAARLASAQASQGMPLSRALDNNSVFPKSLVRWSQWGEAQSALPDALHAAGAMFAERFELRLKLARVFIPAIVFGLIAGSALFVTAGIFRVLYQLVWTLSYWQPNTNEFDPTNIIAASGVVGVLVLGLSLLVVVHILRAGWQIPDAVIVVLYFLSITLMASGLLGGCLLIGGLWGIVLWFVLIAAWVRGAIRYRQTQRQSLWAALALAADKQAPLAPLALAVADEQAGGFAIKARSLAWHLQSGATLAQAIQQVPRALPPEAALAAHVGADAGDMHGAVLATADARRTRRMLMPPAVLWLLLFVPAALTVVLFIEIKIMPSFIKIFDDFEAPLPPVSVMMFGLLNSSLPMLVLCLTAVIALLAILQWRGILQPRLPGLARVARMIELSPVLRVMALVTRHERPLPQAILTIARWHPKRWMRRRLRAAVSDLNDGFTWQESFERRRLLADGDLALLSSAERTGNLPWALDEMGDSFLRRSEYRLKVWGELAMPLLLLVFGLSVALYVIARFVPLTTIINDLS